MFVAGGGGTFKNRKHWHKYCIFISVHFSQLKITCRVAAVMYVSDYVPQKKKKTERNALWWDGLSSNLTQPRMS